MKRETDLSRIFCLNVAILFCMAEKAINIFAERLTDLMQENHLNIKELSAKTKIPRATINGWTLKIASPKIDNLIILADFFGVSVDYLLGREN